MRLRSHDRDYSVGFSGGKRFLWALPTPEVFLLKRDAGWSGSDGPLCSSNMKKALCIGASGGIGQAMASEFGQRGFAVDALSRSKDGLDFSDPGSVGRIMSNLSGPYEVVIIATGVLSSDGASPEKSLAAIEADQMAQVFAANAIGPALILGRLGPVLSKDSPARIGVLSARVGSIGDNRIGGWHSYRASKAAVNQIVHGAAIEFGRTHKGSVCVALHPGTVETPFTANYAGRHKTMPAAEAAKRLVDVLLSLSAEQSGGFFDYAGKEVPW